MVQAFSLRQVNCFSRDSSRLFFVCVFPCDTLSQKQTFQKVYISGTKANTSVIYVDYVLSTMFLSIKICVKCGSKKNNLKHMF